MESELSGASDSFGRELANWLFPLYLGVILAGLLALRNWGMLGGAGNGVRAMFVALNAATLTGFQQSPGLSGLNSYGLYIVLALIVSGSLFNMMVGGLAVRRIAGLRLSDVNVVMGALIVEGLVLLIGAMFTPDSTGGIFNSVFLTAAAFGNCGLSVGNLPAYSSGVTQLLVLPLTVLGGLGITVILEIYRAVMRIDRLSAHSKIVLSTSAWLYVLGFAAIFAINLNHMSGFNSGTAQLAAQSSVLAIESRTGGLPLVSLTQFSGASQWVVVALMVIGASPAGSGGGLKTTTLAELVRGAYRLLNGQPVSRSLGIAMAWLGIYIAMVLGAAVLLSHLDSSAAADKVFFNAVSGVSNVGLSMTELPDEARLMYGYSAIMLLGRMAPLLILWWMADTTRNAEAAIG